VTSYRYHRNAAHGAMLVSSAMMRIVVAALVCAACSASSEITVRVISQSTSSMYEDEPHLAIHGDMVVAVWNATVSASSSLIGYGVSHDHGVTWSVPALIAPPPCSFASDPTVAADSAGRFFLASLRGCRNTNSFAITVAQLDPAIDQFGDPVTLDTGLVVDKPWVAVDAADGVLVTWNNEATIRFARSTDHGGTFAQTIAFAPALGEAAQFAYPCPDPASAQGPLSIVFNHDPGGSTPLSALLVQSLDEGASWTASTAQLPSGISANDATCVARGSDLWIGCSQACGDPNTCEAAAVELVHSADFGVTFSTPVSSSGSAGAILFPQVLVTSAGHVQTVAYVGADVSSGQLELADSSDDGTSWQRTTIANVGPLQSRGDPRGLGDYLGALTDDRGTNIVFVDNSGALSHISFANVSP
jgi:hypothetical protein